MTWLKICGITRLEDALLAESLATDAVGFIFAPSPRNITALAAKKITRSLRTIAKVGVFVDAPSEQVMELRKTLGLDMVQLHGAESPDYCRKLGGTIIKALRIKCVEDLAMSEEYSMVWKILLDAYVETQLGGTGKTLDIDLDSIDAKRIILAGGIGTENAVMIIKRVHPFGLDCNSKLEITPGIKDSEKIREMITLVKQTKQ